MHNERVGGLRHRSSDPAQFPDRAVGGRRWQFRAIRGGRFEVLAG
jgi:hypothetical protein